MVTLRKKRDNPLENTSDIDKTSSMLMDEKETEKLDVNSETITLPEDDIKKTVSPIGDDPLLDIICEVGLSEYVANERVKRDNINMILDSDLFDDTISEMYNFVGRKFGVLSKRIQQNSRNKISAEKVKQPLGSTLLIENNQKKNNMLFDFAGYFYHGFSRNMELISVLQPNLMISISLKNLLDKDDSSYLHDLATRQRQRDTDENGEKKYAFKMTIVSNINSDTTGNTKKIIRTFLCERFVSTTTRAHINLLLEEPKMTTQCIYIHESTNASGFLHSKNQIVGCVLFACEPNIGCLLDYINIKNQYQNKSVGSYLMHAMYIYCQRSILNWNGNIYLCSNQSNFDYYSDIGFCFVPFDSLMRRVKGNTKLRERFQVDMWYDSKNSDDLQEMRIMTNGGRCPPKYRNRLPFLM